MIRPEAVSLGEDGPLRAEVIEATYAGTFVRVTLRHGQQRLEAHIPLGTSLTVGEEVALQPARPTGCGGSRATATSRSTRDLEWGLNTCRSVANRFGTGRVSRSDDPDPDCARGASLLSDKAPGVRLGQAILLLSGGLFLTVVVVPDASRFYWTPLTIGIAYLGAAIVGGRRGGHWATACVLTGWGAAVVFAGAIRPDLDTSGLYLTGAGLGAVTGLLLQRAGVEVSPLGLAGTITGGGLILALTTQFPGVLDNARTYAIGLGAVAVANIVLAVRPGRVPEHEEADPA